MPLTSEEIDLLQQSADALKYVPYVYKGLSIAANTNLSHHYIKHKVGSVDLNSILFFIPTQLDTSNSLNNIQYLKLLQPGEGYNIIPPPPVNIKTYTILIETSVTNNLGIVNTTYEPVKAKQLHLGKLYMLRAISSTELVIVNYNEKDFFQASKVVAVEAEFETTPKVNVNGDLISLVLSTAFDELEARVEALENKIKINQPIDPEDPEETIYIEAVPNGSNEG